MNRELIDSIRKYYDIEISKKNSWGKNEVKNILEKAISDATLEYIDKRELTIKKEG